MNITTLTDSYSIDLLSFYTRSYNDRCPKRYQEEIESFYNAKNTKNISLTFRYFGISHDTFY